MEKHTSLTASGLKSTKEFLEQTLLDIFAYLQSVPELKPLTELPFELKLKNYEGFRPGWQPKTSLIDCVAIKDNESTEFYLDLAVTFEFSSLQSPDRIFAKQVDRQVNKLFSDKDLILDDGKREMFKLPGIVNINYYHSPSHYGIEFVLVYFPKKGEI